MSLRVLSAVLTVGLGLAGLGVGAASGVVPAAAVDAGAPAQVVIVVPLTVPESTDGLIAADSLAQYTSPLGTLTRQLDAVAGRPVVLGIDPRIIVSIRILGSQAPASATSWLARLRAVPNETFPLTYADSDLTLGTQAGSSGVVGPENFDFAINPALFGAAVPTSAPTPTPTPTSAPASPVIPSPAAPPPATSPAADPVVPSLPTSEELLSWPFSRTDIAWPLESTVTTTDMPVLAGSGFSTTILSSANVSRPPGAGAIADIGGARALVADAEVSAALRASVSSVGAADWQSNLDALSATTTRAALAQSGTNATIVATLDRVALGPTNRLADTIDALQAGPNIQLVGFDSLRSATVTPGVIIDQPHPPDQIALMRQLLDARAAEAQFAQIASNPSAITSARRLDLLALQSVSWRDNPTGWPVVVASDLAASMKLRSSVQIASSVDLNFFADSAPLPIAVSNSLDQAVTVWVTVKPDTGLLSVLQPRVELTIEPKSQASANVPAQAISNGTVGVTVSLSSSSGLPVGTSSRTLINVQAGWETPVVVIVAILVVVVFGGGLVRNIVRLRRAAAVRSAAE